MALARKQQQVRDERLREIAWRRDTCSRCGSLLDTDGSCSMPTDVHGTLCPAKTGSS
jgi:hypothetical protein